MNNHVGSTPPDMPTVGSLWYNTTNNEFYVMDEHNRWIAIDRDNLVTDVIMHKETVEDFNEAYERAMGVI